MIIKYKNDQTWFYEDRVVEVRNRHFVVDELISKYNKEVDEGMRKQDFLDFCNDPDVAKANKCFYTIYGTEIESGIPVRFFINPKILSDDCLINLIIITRECGEEPVVGIITNQPAFLLNDAGKTIERLA